MAAFSTDVNSVGNCVDDFAVGSLVGAIVVSDDSSSPVVDFLFDDESFRWRLHVRNKMRETRDKRK